MLVDKAIEFAARAHDGQTRKGTDLPYVSHTYAVGMMLAQAGYPDEIVAAGILHDTVEDTPVTLEQLQEEFGEKVASIVEGCSEPHKGDRWELRKQHTLAYLPTAPADIRAVALADKLHNLRTIVAEHERSGEGVWARFNRGRREQEWYYRGLYSALCTTREGEEPLPFCGEFAAEIEKLFPSAEG